MDSYGAISVILRIVLCICFLVVTLTCHAEVVFSGKGVVIPISEWRILANDTAMTPEQLAPTIDEYQWTPIGERLTSHYSGLDLWRLDLQLTENALRNPILVISRSIAQGQHLTLIREGRLLLTITLGEAKPALQEQLINSYLMIDLPVVHPGRYQLILQGSREGNLDVIHGAGLYLKDDFLVREYPARLTSASISIGALILSMFFCLILMVYQYHKEFLYTLVFITGAFATVLLREGVLFMYFDMHDYRWSQPFLPFAQGLNFSGAILYISADLYSSRWRRSKLLLNTCGWSLLFLSCVNMFYQARGNAWLLSLATLLFFIGLFWSMVVLFWRALLNGWRDRLFALCLGYFCFVGLYSNFFGYFAKIDLSFVPLYLANNVVMVFIFGEYLFTLARDYSQKQAYLSADLARVDLVNRFSHELRTPLNAVIGLSDLIKETSQKDKADNYARMIQSAGHSLLDLVNDILDFSKLSKTGIPLAKQPIRIDSIISDVLASFMPKLLDAPAASVSHYMDPHLNFFYLGDEVRLKQIFGNLISNAIKFSNANDKIRVRIRGGENRNGKQELLCSVIDKGRGIPADKLESIFEPYVQNEAVDSGFLKGTGLGLAICKSLVEEMGGKISVVSEPGVGTTFSFNLWLPVNPDAPDLHQLFAPLAGKRVLILSRYEYFRIVADFLAVWGAHPEKVSNTAEAPDAPFDLILADMIHPLPAADIEWLNRQPAKTVLELFEVNTTPQTASIVHPNAHTLTALQPLLNIMQHCVENLTGKPHEALDIDNETEVLIETKHSVLLVDDNKINLLVTGKILESLNVSCDTAQGGEQGIKALFSDKNYSLVLLDCEMPDIDGFEVSQQWRAFEKEHGLKRTPVVALTAHALKEVEEKCLAAGMNEVLYKPVSRNGMIALLNRYRSHIDPDQTTDSTIHQS